MQAPNAAVVCEPKPFTSEYMTIMLSEMTTICRPMGRPLPTRARRMAGSGRR